MGKNRNYLRCEREWECRGALHRDKRTRDRHRKAFLKEKRNLLAEQSSPDCDSREADVILARKRERKSSQRCSAWSTAHVQQVRAEGWTPSSKRRSVGPQRGEVDDGRDTWREPGTKGLEGSGNDFLWRLGSREEEYGLGRADVRSEVEGQVIPTSEGSKDEPGGFLRIVSDSTIYEAPVTGRQVCKDIARSFVFLKWQSTHNITDSALRDLLASTLPSAYPDTFYNQSSLRESSTGDQSLNLSSMRYLSTVHRINSALERVSGFSPKIIDCCVNSCHAFYGSWAKDASCRVCGERRYITEGLVSKARRTFRYLPLIPRLHLLVHSESLSHKMSYRSKNAPSWSSGEHREVLRDYFDGKLYLDLDRKVNLLPRDILFCFSTDGFALFEKFRHDSWPLLLINLNMSPVDRAKIENMIPLGIIPGPKAPVCIESFLEPMMEEFQVLSRGVLFRNAENRASAFVRSFIFMVTGDLPAIAKICRLTGHNSRVPCRYCKIEGMYLPYKRHIYYPSFVRLTDSDRNEDEISTKQLYDPACLPERRSSETAEKLRELKMPSNSSGSNEIRKLGISGVSAFFNLASLDMFRSFPIDTMHLNYENVAKSMWKLWSSNWTSSYFNSSDNFVLSNASLYSIGAELQAASKTVPEGFGRPPRDITKDWGAFKAEDWIHWTLHYSVISLEGRLPEPYFSNWCIFVKLCVLCHQKVLQRSSIQLIEDSALEFFRQYESIYARHDMNRIFLMRYTVHLLLHLFESAQDCGPLPGCSQFPMERFIGTLCPMIKSNSKPVENLTKHLVLLERLKIAKWKGVYDSTQDEVIKQRRYIATNRRLQMDSEDKPRPELGYYAFLSPTRKGILTLKEIKLLKNYYMKAELFDANHPEGAFYSENRVNEVTFWDRLELLDYGEKLDEAFIVSSRYCSSSRREGSRSRNFVAADFLEGKSSFPKRYYGSVEKLFSHEWRGIQSMLAIISWGEQVISSGKGAIFLKGEVKIAFSKETTIESVEVIRRGIGVFERTEGSARRSKTFIIDPDALLESHNVEWVDCIPSKVI